MKKNYTYIGAVLDRSGSMGSMSKIDEARGSFNNFIKEQKELEGEADVYLTIFDDKIETLYNGNINDCIELNKANFFARGATCLYDAIGLTVNNIGKTLAGKQESERPDKVIILIITDGMENSSKEYNSETLNELITEQREKYSWEFIFMGTTEEAIKDAQSFGVVNTFAYSDTSIGTQSAYSALSSATVSYRNTGSIDYDEIQKVVNNAN